ncbi:hypothetical protein V8E52_004410 [Russula decolorans]
MDFLYLAGYESHTGDTILELQESLQRFHDNKSIFIDLGIRGHFSLPKLHSLSHYASSIRLFGTTDNYNIEQSERLHIDFAKDAYHATNHKDEFSQMTKWLERRERIQHLSSFIDWMQEHREPWRVLFDVLAEDYGALDFQDALADFIAQANNPGASGAALRHRAHDTHIPFSGVPVYHNMKFTNGSESDIVDVVHVRPEQNDSRGQIIPGRFDTALVNGKP